MPRRSWLPPLTALLLVLAHPMPARAQFVQQGTKVVPPTATSPADVGISVALSADGNTAIIGASTDNTQGAAYIYVRTGGGWIQQGGKLIGSSGSTGGLMGHTVAISADGNTVAIGGPSDNSNVGAAWIFTRSAGVWLQQGAKLTGSGEVGAGQYGYVVALSSDGNTLAASGPNDNGNVGAVWVYTRTNGTWTPQGSKLVGTGATGAALQGFGLALSGDGDLLMEGGPLDNTSVGAAWAFKRTSGNWAPLGGKLVGTGGWSPSQQGIAVAISTDGTTAAVGGNFDNGIAGATWVYTYNGSAWLQQGARLIGSNGIPTSWQGIAVSLAADGNTLVVGGAIDNGLMGAAWQFTRSKGAWTQVGDKLTGAGNSAQAEFGRSTALSADGRTLLVGGPIDSAYVGAFWYFVQPQPQIVSVTDVRNDQGGEVSIRFGGSVLDATPSDPIGAYGIWRQVPASIAAARARRGGAIRTTAQGAQTWYWEYVGSEPAHGFAGYSYTAPTLSDSVAGANPYTAFMVEAQQTAAGLYWPSAPDSGYSVDNLAPAAPLAASAAYAAAGTQLAWSPNMESDLAGYRVYRGGTAGFTPSTGNRVAQMGANLTHWQDAAGPPYFYKLTAVDVHGNESPAATIVLAGTTAVPGPGPYALSLAIAGPNPAARATAIAFTLPAAATVSLAIHDAAGRRVRTLADGAWLAGEHTMTWDLRDAAGHAVTPGLYFARLTTGSETRVRRVAVVE